MNSDNKEKIYCDVDGEYRNYCCNWDKLAIDGYYNNHLKSQTLLNNLRKRQHLIIQIIQHHHNNSLLNGTSNYKTFPKVYFQFYFYRIVYHQMEIV